jgi:hypothetical protein
VDWAKTILAANPNRNVIILTHSHLNSDGTIMTSNGGYGDLSPSNIYNQLKGYANIKLYLSGHVDDSAWRNDPGTIGNRIYQVLQDYQGQDFGGGYLRLFEIDTVAGSISARMYSPYYNITKTDHSKFSFSNVNFIGGPLTNGTYKMLARHSGKGIQVRAAGTGNGSKVEQWGYTGGNHQRWTLTNLGSGQYNFRGVASGRVIDIAAVSPNDGAYLHIWDWLSAQNQKWTVTHTSNGYYRSLSVFSGKAMDISGVSTADGAQLQQWTYGGGNNQQFGFWTP